MLSGERILACHRQVFFITREPFFAFCNVVLSINSISFDNSMQWMSKLQIYIGYTVEKYVVEESKFSWEKNRFAFFL